MSFVDDFGMVRIINLPERTDRRREMEKELELAHVPLDHPSLGFFPAIRCTQACGFPSAAVRGCFLSHLAVLREAHQAGVRRLLVLEDDALLVPGFPELWNEMLPELDRQPWAFAYFGYSEEDVPFSEPAPSRLLPCDLPLGCTHFYAVHESILGPLIQYLEAVQSRPEGHPAGGPMHYDGALSMFRAAHPDVVTLRAYPRVAMQRSSRSDIYIRWFERLPGLRQVSEQLRRAKARYFAAGRGWAQIPE